MLSPLTLWTRRCDFDASGNGDGGKHCQCQSDGNDTSPEYPALSQIFTDQFALWDTVQRCRQGGNLIAKGRVSQ